MNWGSKLTEVDKNFVWREHVKKEKRCFKFDNEFQANPYRLNVVTDKPNQRPKRFLDKHKANMETVSKFLPEGYLTKFEEPVFQEDAEDLKKTQIKQAEIEKFNDKLSSIHKTPNVKYDMPQTSAQEVGWFKEPLYVSKGSDFDHPLTQCPITKYADALIRSSTTKSKSADTKATAKK